MESMTKEMHEIAKKTKQETVSMRVITSVTLFFLPATFIAVSPTIPGISKLAKTI
jgi:Mg2+ and Co2+ transporter CorA